VVVGGWWLVTGQRAEGSGQRVNSDGRRSAPPFLSHQQPATSHQPPVLHRIPTRRRTTHSAQRRRRSNAYAHPVLRRRGAASTGTPPPTTPSFTRGDRGSHSRALFTASIMVPPRTVAEYSPGGNIGDSATVASPRNRTVIESTRVESRGLSRRSTTCTDESVALPRCQRIGSPARNAAPVGTTALRSARSAASQSKRLPQSAAKASAEAPPRNRQCHRPDALTITTRLGVSLPAMITRRSSSRPRRTSRALH